MESRSVSRRLSKPDKLVEVLEEESTGKSPVTENLTVRVVTNIPGTLKVSGPVTGNSYVFPSNGVAIDMDMRDARVLVAETRGGCCGSKPRPFIFYA